MASDAYACAVCNCHHHTTEQHGALPSEDVASDYDCEHGYMHGECWVTGCNHQAENAKGRPWQEAPEWTI